MNAVVRPRKIATASLFLGVLSISEPLRALSAQTPPSIPDRVMQYSDAQLLSSRADSLAHGSASDQQEAMDLLRRAAESYRKAGAHRDAAAMHNRIGLLYRQQGQPDSALTYLRRALLAAPLRGDRTEETKTLNQIGAVLRGIGQNDSALVYLRQALSIARRTGDGIGEADALSEIGQVFLRIGQPDSAFRYFRPTLAIYRGEANRAAEARTLNDLGWVFRGIGLPDSAMAYHRQALRIVRAVGDRAGDARTLFHIAVIFRDVGRLDSALAYARQALPLRRAAGDRNGEASTLAIIGIVFAGLGQRDSALAYYREALPIFRAVSDRAGEARTLTNFGLVFNDIGEPDSALVYHRQALPISRAVGDRAGEAATLSNIGVVLNVLGQRDSALVYYRQALLILRLVGNRAGEPAALSNIGRVFRIRGQPDSAMVYFRQALALWRIVGDRAGEARTLNNIAAVLVDLRQADSALAYFHQALPISHAAGDRAVEAGTLESIGGIYRDMGRLDSAVAYYREALPMAKAAGARAYETVTLRSLGALYQQLGQLDSAIAYFDRSTALLSTISTRAGSDFNRLSYNETTTDAYGLLTLAWLALAPSRDGAGMATMLVEDSASAGYAALAAAERGRARALLDLMRDTTTEIQPGADFPAEGARLAATLRRSNSAGLVYFITRDTLITWVISSGGRVDVFARAISGDSLAALVGRFRDDLGAHPESARLVLRGGNLEGGADRHLSKRVVAAGAAWYRRADELATILLPPGVVRRLKTEKEVVIVPQSSIALVPFAGLPVGTAGEPLGARLAVRYAPSLGTLDRAEERAWLAMRPQDRRLTQALVVGNPAMPEVSVSDGTRDRLAPLPGAEAEGRSIAAQLGTVALAGTAATETEVVRRLANAPLVHLATHGFAYSTDAKTRSSFVALAPDSLNDGLLTVGKILDNSRLKLSADLVVLSACQTALGDLKQAEGTVGLQRAFLAKGARSVLVSLWNVSDAATRKLMTGFYRHWLRDPDHPSKAESLRRAQEEVRKTQGFEHPRFWAAFQLVGAR